MDEAAPQAAGGIYAEDTAKVLDAPRLLWEDDHLIGFDEERGWWASRPGRAHHDREQPRRTGPDDRRRLRAGAMTGSSSEWRHVPAGAGGRPT
jgi:hypothetical protein